MFQTSFYYCFFDESEKLAKTQKENIGCEAISPENSEDHPSAVAEKQKMSVHARSLQLLNYFRCAWVRLSRWGPKRVGRWTAEGGQRWKPANRVQNDCSQNPRTRRDVGRGRSLNAGRPSAITRVLTYVGTARYNYVTRVVCGRCNKLTCAGYFAINYFGAESIRWPDVGVGRTPWIIHAGLPCARIIRAKYRTAAVINLATGRRPHRRRGARFSADRRGCVQRVRAGTGGSDTRVFLAPPVNRPLRPHGPFSLFIIITTRPPPPPPLGLRSAVFRPRH